MNLLAVTLLLSSLIVSLVHATPIDPVFSRAHEPRKAKAAVNNGTIELLKELEGFSPDFYNINGRKTIGYGHDCVAKKDCDKLKAPLSDEEATDLFAKDLDGFEDCVCELPNAKELNANQYGALVSFAYNSGCGGVRRDWEQRMKKKDFDGICKAIGGVNTLAGLLDSRRKEEAKHCGKETKDKSGC